MLFMSSAHLPRNGAVALGSAAPAEAASPSRQNDAIAATGVDFFTATSLCWRCDVCYAVIAEGGEHDQSGSFAVERPHLPSVLCRLLARSEAPMPEKMRHLRSDILREQHPDVAVRQRQVIVQAGDHRL